MQLPIVERVAERVGGRATVGVVNVDEVPAVAVHCNVEAIPTMVVFKNGQVARRFAGVHSEAGLTTAIFAVADAAEPGLSPLG